jgi:hypothetical protein
MKTLIKILSFFLILSCSDSEKVKNKIDSVSNEKTSIQKTLKQPPPKGWFDVSSNQDDEAVFFDTIPILDKVHFACFEFHDIDDIVFSVVRKDKDSLAILIPKFRKVGGFYDTILVQDYNFDGIKDLDFVLRPGCRSGANACHNIYLNKDSKFIKAAIPQYSFLTPIAKEKTIYGMYNGEDDFELIKAKWKGDSLIVNELVDIEIITLNKNYHYKAIFYDFEGTKKIKIKEEIIKKFPKNYTKVLSENILY